MKPSEHDDTYRVFPYRPEIHDEGVNNGGINLIDEPEDIAKISEATAFPALRSLLVELNQKDGELMTLGCAYWPSPDVVQGYVEFSFRNIDLANNEAYVASIDEMFNAWLAKNVPDTNELAQRMAACLAWEYSEFQYYETAPRLKIAVFYRARDPSDAGHLLAWLGRFLSEGLSFPASTI